MSGAESRVLKTAFHGELMLAGWSETHNGGAKVTFWLPSAEELDAFRHMTVKKGNTAGHRFAAVLVELDDNDQPAGQVGPQQPQPQPQGPEQPEQPEQPEPMKGGPLARDAAVICAAPEFQRFAAAMADAEAGAEGAAEFVRERCGIKSRRELDHSREASRAFAELMAAYREWREGRCL